MKIIITLKLRTDRVKAHKTNVAKIIMQNVKKFFETIEVSAINLKSSQGRMETRIYNFLKT